MKQVLSFVKKETILCVAIFLAILSSFFIGIDKEYIDYIDYHTLAILFCLMTVMSGLRENDVFDWLAQSLLQRVKNMRQVILLLIMLCFFFSMLITNDVALITFVPLAIIIFDKMNIKLKERWLIPVVVMQTIAANLGSMLTPIGNPQNLYLYAKSGISLMDFILLMLPYTLLAFVLLLLFGIFATRSQKEKLSINLTSQNAPLAKRKIVIYLILFMLCILTVARVLSNWITFIIVFITALLMERQVLKKVDYSLLLTFVGFFIFIGNMGRMPAFCSFLEKVITGNEIITAVVASQAISNVPAALLLSGFTKNYEALIIGTNIGGLGTLIASMASLISFKYIAKETPQMKGKYFLNFTITNILFLLAMLACAKIN